MSARHAQQLRRKNSRSATITDTDEAASRQACARDAVVVAIAIAHAQRGVEKPRRIAVFGSSIANGTGDELAREGYSGRLRELLAPRGW
jgi:hypothetical protein